MSFTRRGFLGNIIAALGVTTLPAQQADYVPLPCGVKEPHQHIWEKSDYVLVLDGFVVTRGPKMDFCSKCGALRITPKELTNL